MKSSYCICFFFLFVFLIASVFCPTQHSYSYCHLRFLCCTAFESCLLCENSTCFFRNGSLSFAVIICCCFFTWNQVCLLWIWNSVRNISGWTGQDGKRFYFPTGWIRSWSVIEAQLSLGMLVKLLNECCPTSHMSYYYYFLLRSRNSQASRRPHPLIIIGI